MESGLQHLLEAARLRLVGYNSDLCPTLPTLPTNAFFSSSPAKR
jgi:hypothetical protein